MWQRARETNNSNNKILKGASSTQTPVFLGIAVSLQLHPLNIALANMFEST